MSRLLKVLCCGLVFANLLPVQVKAAEDLVIFSGRKEPLIAPVIDLFEKKTGVEVTLKTGDSAALGQQILQEIERPSVDVFIAKESGSLEYLRLQNAFEPYRSAATDAIPAAYKAEDGTWIGVSGRSRAVIYNTELVDPADVPQTLNDLVDPRWKGKIAAVNAGNESFVAWVAALRLQLGEEAAEQFLQQLKANEIQLLGKSHTDIRKSVGRGEYPLGLINHYYYHLQKHESDEDLTHVGIQYLDQGEGERGELVNVSGAAIVRNAPHPEAAREFIDFLASPDAQRLFAEVNFEYPLIPQVPAHSEVRASLSCEEETVLDCLHTMDVHLDDLGEEWENTLRLLEKLNWH